MRTLISQISRPHLQIFRPVRDVHLKHWGNIQDCFEKHIAISKDRVRAWWRYKVEVINDNNDVSQAELTNIEELDRE